jgi:hypothetical protein
LDTLRDRLDAIREDLAAMKAELGRKFSRTLMEVVRRKEAEEAAAAAELLEERARSVVPAERAWGELPSLVDLVRKHGDEARLKLRAVLRRVVETMSVLIVPRGSWKLCAVQFHFTGGATRGYLIGHQSAANGRPGRRWCRSIADAAADAGGPDLRKKSHAAKLAKALESISAEELSAAAGP